MIPKSHPRYESLMQRHMIEEGVKEGYVTMTGMIAQGRGEAFDYLLGEKTIPSADLAEKAAVSAMKFGSPLQVTKFDKAELVPNVAMRHSGSHTRDLVISVNGNVAALCPKEVVGLSKLLGAKLEVNLFYWTKEREEKIGKILKDAGAKRVYGIGEKVQVPGLDSARGSVDPEGIAKADMVLVMLEDGDRTEALRSWGKKVIAIDLNPFSRTARMADIAIVDNVVRAIPNMINYAKEEKSIDSFDNTSNLKESFREIRKNLGY